VHSKVKWKGPNNQGDFISIDPAGAPDRTYGNYAYPSNGNPVELSAPDKAGDYLVRYHLANTYRVIGSVPLKVGGVAATLKFPATARAGGMLAGTWTGPAKKGEFISIDAVGANDRTYGNYAYPERGNPLEVRVPDDPGRLRRALSPRVELWRDRQRAAQGRAVTASVTRRRKVAARSVFDVSWKGPDNPGDFITLVRRQPRRRSSARATATRSAATRRVSRHHAPPATTSCVTSRARATARSRRTALVVTPSGEPAKIRVTTQSQDAAGAFGAAEFVLDAVGQHAAEDRRRASHRARRRAR
jgi:hypothetical protein